MAAKRGATMAAQTVLQTDAWWAAAKESLTGVQKVAETGQWKVAETALEWAARWGTQWAA